MALYKDSPEEVQLQRLSTFIDVVYALIFFSMLTNYLPVVEDMTWTSKPYGLFSLLVEKRSELLRIFIGAGLALLYWNQNTNLFKNLAKTDVVHSTLSLIQLSLVCLFVYFAIADPSLEGGPSSPVLQAASLALAGFTGIGSWLYAVKKEMIRPEINTEDIRSITNGNLMEPLTASVNTGLAFIGPLVWTLAWFILPVGFAWLLSKKKIKPIVKL
jgi:hypothetical protein